MKKEIFFITLLLMLILSFNSAAQEKWVNASKGYIPKEAFVGGYDDEGSPLYVVRAYYKGGLYPGYIKKGWSFCGIGYGKKFVGVEKYEVLVYPGRKESAESIKIKGNISVKIQKLLDSYDWKRSLFLSDKEKESIRDNLIEIQKLALAIRCYELSDKINKFKEFLAESMPNRTKTKNKLIDLYETSKKC